MSGQIDELTRIAAEEGGKPWQDSRIEVLRAINGVKLAIEHIPHIKGEQIPMGQTDTRTFEKQRNPDERVAVPSLAAPSICLPWATFRDCEQ